MVMAMALATGASAQQPSTGSQQPGSSGSQPQSSTRANQSSRESASEQTFAMKAAQANMAEIELGKLAQQKADRDEVKKFGQQMVDDHSKALDELKTIASKHNMTLPSGLDAEHKALSEKLSKLDGAAFDRAYIQAMVDGHKKVASDFRKESQSGKDADLKAYAAKTLPTVEEHLKHAEMLNKNGSTSTR